MKILITGANGQLGQELILSGQQKRFDVIGLTRSQLDISNAREVQSCINDTRPDLIINAAAYTKVDLAESEPELAYAVNVNGVVNLAANSARLSIPLLHISTDYVFDGNKQTAYTEDDQPNPVGVYGKSKWLGEIALKQILTKHLILRVSWVYGLQGANFVKTMIRLGKERETIKVVNDQHGCPTSTAGIAEVIFKIIAQIQAEKFQWGTYHYCEGPALSWFDFAKSILQSVANYDSLKIKEVLPIPTSEFPTPAKRPVNSVMTCQKLIDQLDFKPFSWQEMLPSMIRGLYS